MAGQGKAKKMVIKYVFPTDLRDLHVSGASGGITPKGEINLHFYSERRPLPKSVTISMTPENEPEDEKTEYGADIIRLMQASLVMDINTVLQVRDFLDSVLTTFDEQEEQEEEEK